MMKNLNKGIMTGVKFLKYACCKDEKTYARRHMSRKGKLALEYLAVIALALIVLIVVLIFSSKIREKAFDAGRSFLGIIGRR
ncbi:MAG: hypothetical protein KJ955_08035 [Nanoarchaeota archaeon]|nr:hypothetical protein [Nanoarchaeota archaeon]